MLEIKPLSHSLKSVQYAAVDREANMPEIQSDIDYTVNIHRGETSFRANTSKGEKFLGGPELTLTSEEAHDFIQEARTTGLTVKSVF